MKIFSLLFASVLFLFASHSQAQDDDEKNALITFTGGWCYADYIANNEVVGATKPRSGFFAGVRKDVKIIPMLHFNTGLIFTQQGAVFTGISQDTEIKTSYFDIPLGLKFKAGSFFATGGVSGNILVGDNFEELGFDEEESSELKSFDLVYSLGVGAKLSIFSLDLRWNSSFGDIVKDNNRGTKIKNSYFLVGLGISINRKK